MDRSFREQEELSDQASSWTARISQADMTGFENPSIEFMGGFVVWSLCEPVVGTTRPVPAPSESPLTSIRNVTRSTRAVTDQGDPLEVDHIKHGHCSGWSQ